MTREEIIKLAREARVTEVISLSELRLNALERFAALVAAEIGIETHRRGYESGLRDGAIAEREACAKVADSISEDQWALYKGRPPYTGKELERASDYTQGKSDGAEVCAAAIRERSANAGAREKNA